MLVVCCHSGKRMLGIVAVGHLKHFLDIRQVGQAVRGGAPLPLVATQILVGHEALILHGGEHGD